MAEASQELSAVILDDVWMLMKYAAGTKEDETSTDDFLKTMPDHFQFECSVTASDGDEEENECPATSDTASKSENERKESIQNTAERLAALGDNLCKDTEDGAQLVTDITDSLLKIAKQFDDTLDKRSLKLPPPQDLFKSGGIMNMAYDVFKTKLQKFLGLDETVDKLAVVTHVTRGVASSFKNSDLPMGKVVPMLAYKFVTDGYPHILQKCDSVTELAKPAKKPEDTSK